MPWEVIGNVLLEATISEALKGGYKLFQDHVQPWITAKLAGAYAERYLLLTSPQLCDFYYAETPLSYTFGRSQYRLPMSLLIAPTTDGPATEEKIRIKTTTIPFTVPQRISIYTTPLLEYLRTGKDSRLFDGQVVSLRSVSKNEVGEWELMVATGSYFEGLATNFAMDHRPRNLTQSLRMFISGENGQLGNIAKIPLVNHMGVICMIESQDGMLVVQERSANVANRPNTLSSSVSGALDWSDVCSQSEWAIEGLSMGILRESFEELGVKPENVWFLGLVREYLRGGKPEVYFYAKSDCTFYEIEAKRKTAKDRKESKKLIPCELHTNLLDPSTSSKLKFYDRVVRILEDVGKRAILTLVAGVCLLANRCLGLNEITRQT